MQNDQNPTHSVPLLLNAKSGASLKSKNSIFGKGTTGMLPELEKKKSVNPDIPTKPHKKVQGLHLQNHVATQAYEQALKDADETIAKSAANAASRQKAGGNFDRMNAELSKTRMNFGIRSDRQEISKLMRGGEEMDRKPS